VRNLPIQHAAVIVPLKSSIHLSLYQPIESELLNN